MHSTILINEFLPDPEGTDSQVLQEWIEIVNVSENDIDISSLDIQIAGKSYTKIFTFPNGSLAKPGQYILICEPLVENCDYYSTKAFGIQNGGNETDGIRIRNAQGEVMDTVLYDTTNSNELLNDFCEIEKDENIVEMPGTGCSLARKNFLDSNFSIQDFFVACTTTPGKKNLDSGNILLSEIALDFLEFYSSNIPSNLDKWYVKESKDSSQKYFLANGFNNNFFVLETQKPLNNVYLYSPENTLIDSFSTKRISKHFSFCRLDSKGEEDFSFCEVTKGEKNETKSWKALNLLEVIQLGVETDYIVDPCVMYKYENIFVIADNTAALGVECENCIVDKCFTSEILFKKTKPSSLQTLQESPTKKIAIETVNKQNYDSLFNKIVFLQGQYQKSDSNFSYFLTDIGEVKRIKGDFSKDSKYIFKGILENNNGKILNYPVLIKQEPIQTLPTLENTGDPLFLLVIFLILPFLLFKIFAKLLTIKLFKRTSL
jgi:hypothetical protein